MRWLLLAALLAPLSALAAFEANGVALGEPEAEVRKSYPNAHCKPLEWESTAADRRCDDSRADFGGVKVRITFYLKNDAVEAFDVRFNTEDLERLMAVLRQSYGRPASEGREKVERPGKSPREFFRAQWRLGNAHASLSSEIGRRRSSMVVSRGDFDEEIYRVR
jgi:hypothetical protein